VGIRGSWQICALTKSAHQPSGHQRVLGQLEVSLQNVPGGRACYFVWWPDIGQLLRSRNFLTQAKGACHHDSESLAYLLTLSSLRQPGVARSSPSSLTTSLAIPVPSSSPTNGPTITRLTTRGLCPGGCQGRSNVRSASLVKCDWNWTDRLGSNGSCL